MANDLGSSEDRHAVAEHDGYCRVFQVVKADRWNVSGSHQRFEVSIDKAEWRENKTKTPL
jgi:hypothetical protein